MGEISVTTFTKVRDVKSLQPIDDTSISDFFYVPGEGESPLYYWAGPTISYGTDVSNWEEVFGTYEEGKPMLAMTDAMMQMVDDLLGELERYIDIDFVRDDTDPLVNMAYTENEFGGAGSAGRPGPENYHGSITFADGFAAAMIAGDGQSVVMHEILHALGIDHPFDYVDGAYVMRDGIGEYGYQEMSVMPYYDVQQGLSRVAGQDLNEEVQTWLWGDIRVLQAIYGVDQTHTIGNDTYRFDTEQAYFEVLWDTSGTDKIIIQNDGDVSIDLRGDTWLEIGQGLSYSDGATLAGSIFLPDEVLIENISSGGGDDRLIGNEATNRINGDAGDDNIIGLAGSDTLTGGWGNDTLNGGTGDDELWAGDGDGGDDFFDGGAGNDIIGSGGGDDFAVGGDGTDRLFGGDGNDILLLGLWEDENENDHFDSGEAFVLTNQNEEAYGGAGDDTIKGTAGHETLGGGDGNDNIAGWAGNDQIFGGRDESDDVLNGGLGHDEIYGGAGDDTLIGDMGNDLLFSGAGTDNVFGGAGNDSIWGGGGDDLFTGGTGADTFAFAFGNGNDTIQDFTIGEDRLLFEGVSIAELATLAASDTTQNGQSGVLLSFDDTTSVFLVGLTADDISNNIAML